MCLSVLLNCWYWRHALHPAVSLLFEQPSKSSQCYPYIYKCETSHWNTGNLPVAIEEFLPPQPLSAANCSSGRGEALWVPTPSTLVFQLSWYCAGNHSYSFMGTKATACPEDSTVQHSSTSFNFSILFTSSSVVFLSWGGVGVGGIGEDCSHGRALTVTYSQHFYQSHFQGLCFIFSCYT